MHRIFARTAFAVAGTLAVVVATAVPSAAALPGTASVKVGSSTQVGVTTGWLDNAYKQHATRLIGNFTSHTTNSVKMTSLKLCYSAPAGSQVLVSVTGLKDNSTVLWSGAIKQFAAGTCQTWTVNKTFSKQASGNLVTMTVRGAVSSQRTYTAFKR